MGPGGERFVVCFPRQDKCFCKVIMETFTVRGGADHDPIQEGQKTEGSEGENNFQKTPSKRPDHGQAISFIIGYIDPEQAFSNRSLVNSRFKNGKIEPVGDQEDRDEDPEYRRIIREPYRQEHCRDKDNPKDEERIQDIRKPAVPRAGKV